MKKFSLFIAISVCSLCSYLYSQTPTWSEEIAPIVFQNCAQCHNSNGVAPFSLESYTDAIVWGNAMATNVAAKKMPPWPPVSDYCHYANERVLSQQQIDKIVNWVNGGMPEGNPALTPPLPTFRSGPLLGVPDMKLTIPTHTSQAATNDEYACFVIPTGLTQDKYVRGIQIVPGNNAIVHHVIVQLDASATVTDCMLGLVGGGQTMYSWAAGMSPAVFPNSGSLKMGMKLPAGSNILVQIHYPVGSSGKSDSTSILFYLYSDAEATSTNPPMRELKEDLYVMNWVFAIPANSTQTLHANWPAVGNTTQDLSLLSIDPHMHLLGRRVIVYAVTPNHDTIPLNKIDDWRYSWQSYYFFKNLIKIPAGSKIYADAFYDNTSNNPYNPFNPPQLCLPGEQTTNEMMLTACQYAVYQPGDENFDIEGMINDAINAATGVPEVEGQNEFSFAVYPNPTNGELVLMPSKTLKGKTQRNVTDILGKNIYSKTPENMQEEPLKINLQGRSDGVYFLQVQNAGSYFTKKITLATK